MQNKERTCIINFNYKYKLLCFMSNVRALRFARLVERELVHIFSNKLRDPRLHGVSITRVAAKSGTKLIDVFFVISDIGASNSDELNDSVSSSNSSKHLVKAALKRAVPHIRSLIADALEVRVVPNLRFFYDESVSGVQKLLELIDNSHSS